MFFVFRAAPGGQEAGNVFPEYAAVSQKRLGASFYTCKIILEAPPGGVCSQQYGMCNTGDETIHPLGRMPLKLSPVF